MTALTAQDRVRSLLEAGWQSLGAGRSREASDIFGRVLLQDPAHDEARRGLQEAREALAEEERRLATRLDEARRALEANDHDQARRVLETTLQQGGESEAVLRLLESVGDRGGWVEGRSGRAVESASELPPAMAAPEWSRRLLVVAWAVIFGVLAAGVASSWDRLVFRLASTPAPHSPAVPVTTQLAAPTSAERDLREARRLIEQGDLHAAVRALDRIPPDEPSYPFARQLRAQAESALRQPAHSR